MYTVKATPQYVDKTSLIDKSRLKNNAKSSTRAFSLFPTCFKQPTE